MITVILPSSMQERTGGSHEFTIDGATAGEVLRNLERQEPSVAGWVLDEQSRLRRHMKLFVNADEAELDTLLRAGDELYVVSAISGGSAPAAAPDGDSATAPIGGELLVGTHKGLIVRRGDRGGPMEIAGREFPGQAVEYAIKDHRTGRYFASVTHGQHGPRLFFTDDPADEWQQADGPSFPKWADASATRLWVIAPGVEDGVVWAGVAPAALFRSDDNGETWTLNEALWNDPSRPQWEGGAGGLCLHSICPWPGDPQRLALAISAVGVWITDDGGESWCNRNKGLVSRYLPEEARESTLMHCVHNLWRAPRQPETMFMQFHGGVYRSDDAGESWNDIAAQTELPADFGFPPGYRSRRPRQCLRHPHGVRRRPRDRRRQGTGVRDAGPRRELDGAQRRPAANECLFDRLAAGVLRRRARAAGAVLRRRIRRPVRLGRRRGHLGYAGRAPAADLVGASGSLRWLTGATPLRKTNPSAAPG